MPSPDQVLNARARTRSGGFATLVRRIEDRPPPARLGTARGALWIVLVAIAFVGMSHPKMIETHMPTVFMWVCGAVAVVVLLDHRSVRLPRMPALAVAFLGFCLLSIIWSSDRPATWYAVLYYSAMALVASMLVANTSRHLFIRGLSVGAIAVMVLSWGMVVIGHPNAFAPGPGAILQGLYGNRNIMAYVLVFGLCALLADRYRTWPGEIFRLSMLAGGFFTLDAARSGTGTVVGILILAVAVGRVVLLRMAPMIRRRAVVAALVVAGLAGVAAVINVGRISAMLGKDANFSGRAPVWEGILNVFAEAPAGGYGWGAVWAYAWYEIDDSAVRDLINAGVNPPLNHGHNAVLDVLVQVGLVGTLIYLAMVVLSLVRALRGPARNTDVDRTWVLLVVVAIMVGGLTEPLFATPIGWFHVVAMAACTAPRRLQDRIDGSILGERPMRASRGLAPV